jgi:hypothetical protein
MTVEQQKKALEDKKAEALQQALKKFTLCSNGLTVLEMKALVMATSKPLICLLRKEASATRAVVQ